MKQKKKLKKPKNLKGKYQKFPCEEKKRKEYLKQKEEKAIKDLEEKIDRL